MKEIYTIVKRCFLPGALIVLMATAVHAQSSLPGNPPNIDTPGLSIDSVIRYMQASLSPDDTGEGGGAAQLAEFARTWKDRVTSNDSSGINMFGQYLLASRSAAAARLASNCANGSNFTGNWTCIGPDSLPSQNLGRILGLWVAPNDTNFLLATGAGGLFKSRDGGRNWVCITDNTPVSKGLMSPTNIAVSPIDTQFIYLGSNSFFGHVKALEGLTYDVDDYGNGLLFTTNGGATWQQEILPMHLPRTWKDSITGAGVLFSPDGHRLYAMMAAELFLKVVGSSWQKITPSWLPPTDHNWLDMQFVPTGVTTQDSSHFFISTTSSDQLFEVFYDAYNQDHTWTSIPLPEVGGPIRFTIPTANMLYLIMHNHNLWRYDIINKNWSFITSVPLVGDIHDTTNAGIWQIAASKANPAIIYFAQDYDIAHMSNDTGHTTVPLCYYGGNPTHTDIRSILIHTATNTSTGIDDRVYFANDGGVSLKAPGINPLVAQKATLININGKGLACGRFLGVGTSEVDGAVLASQADNAFCSYEPKVSSQWHEMGSSDAEEAVIVRTSDTGYVGISGGNPSTGLRIITPAGGRQLGTDDDAGDLTVENHSGLIPQWPDQQGGVYHGQTHMWRSLPHMNFTGQVSGTIPNPVFVPYDIHLPQYLKPGTTNTYPTIKCMTFSQYFDSLTGYVMYEDGSLFYRNYYTGSGPTQNQFNIQPTTDFTSWPATGIVCNPSHPEQVWVSLGGVAPTDTPRKRVMYSPDAAQHWFDISKGLPRRLPVTQIVYQEGSPFVYCSTDIGMFKLDMSTFQYGSISDPMSAYSSVTWTCFNQGAPGQHDFPMVKVSDLEINYCEGKLYAATYGRAIWSTDLMVKNATYASSSIGDFIPEPTEVISANTTWNSERRIYTGVHVTNGATLTITNTGGTQTVIHMPKNGAIVVDSGCAIIVQGAKLTNDCSGFWKGILLKGSPGLGQSPLTQAAAYIRAGSVIEHARVGVANSGDSLTTYNTAGGMIFADSATFLNCAKGVGYSPYHYINGGAYVNYASHIKGCTFSVTDNYRGDAQGYPFQAHISMSDVDGIDIRGNNFKNTRSGAQKGQGIAINSWNSSFQLTPYCATYSGCPVSDYVHNRFDGFKIGVNNDAPLSISDFFFVDYADFQNCSIGILAKNSTDVKVFHSTFKLEEYGKAYSATCLCQKGIYLIGTPSFRIEEDSFSSNTSRSGFAAIRLATEGIRIEDCGPASNDIYRNSFSNLKYGCVSYGVNCSNLFSLRRPIAVRTGLQFICNNYSIPNLVSVGIYVFGAQPSSLYYPSGICGIQGSTSAPVENVYSPSLSSTNGQQFQNYASYISYYYGGASNKAILSDPSRQTPIVTTTGANSCPARQILNPYNTKGYSKRMIAESAFDQAHTDWSNAFTGLQTRMDGGNTASLLYYIDQSTSSTPLHDSLMQLAPYLSEEVLRACAANNKVDKAEMIEVLRACPEMLSDGLLEYLGFLMPGIYPDYDIDTLRHHRGDTTAMSADLSAINGAWGAMSLAHNDVVSAIKYDDSNAVRPDTLGFWYQRLPAQWAQYTAALMYLGAGQWALGDTILAHIPTDMNLSDGEQAVHESYKDLFAVLSPVLQSGRTLLQLDSSELAELYSIADRRHATVSSIALSIYNKNLGIADIPCYPTTEEEAGGEEEERGGKSATGRHPTTAHPRNAYPVGAPISVIEQGSYVKVYPNPAREKVALDYNLPTAPTENLNLTITGANGQDMYVSPLAGKRSTVTIDTHTFIPGVYLYRISSGQKMLYSGRFSIIR